MSVIYSLIFRIGTKPPARFDFLPSPTNLNEDRRSLNRNVPLPHGSVYRGLNGEGLGSITLDGHFGVSARQRNGQNLTGDAMFQALSDYISNYWEATKSRNYRTATQSKIEFHDWQQERHLYVEIQTFSAQRGPQNKVTPRKYSMQLESYGRIEDTAAIASQWPLNRAKETATQTYHWAQGTVEKIELAGRTMSEVTDKAKGFLRQNVLRPLKALTGSLEVFSRGLTSVLTFPLQSVNALGNACVDTIVTMGNVITQPAIELIRVLRGTRRMCNRLRSLPDLFKDQFDAVTSEWSAFQYEGVTTADSEAQLDAKRNGINLARKRSAIQAGQVSGTGVREISVVQGDTLQRIAARELGDASRWTEIAILNDIDGNDALASLTSLLLPSDAIPTQIAGQLSDTRLVTTEEKLFGRDLLLAPTNDGKLSVFFDANGDLATVAGLDNLMQAVMLRQRIMQGQLLEDPLYGLRAVIGSSQATQGADELAWSLRYSALADPRVERVDVTVDVQGNETTYTNVVYPAQLSGTRPIQSTVRAT